MGSSPSISCQSPGFEQYTTPDDVVGLASFADEILLFTESKKIEIRSNNDILSTRTLSLKPTCACATESGAYIVGFENGFLSEFDSDLNLVMTFSKPGNVSAHRGDIVQVASSAGCHLISIGGDKVVNLWNANGGVIKSYSTTGKYTSICCSDACAWVSDTNLKMIVIDLKTKDVVKSFQVPSIITSMTLLSNGRGCIAALDDRSVVLFSAHEVLANMSFHEGEPISMVCPLHCNSETGLVTYLAVDKSGVLSLRALEFMLAEIGNALPFFAITNNEVVCIIDNKIVRLSKSQIEAQSLKNLPEMELPRTRIRNFLQQKDQTLESNVVEMEEEEEEFND